MTSEAEPTVLQSEPAHPQPSYLSPTSEVLHSSSNSSLWTATFCGRPCVIKQSHLRDVTALQQAVRILLKVRKFGVLTPTLYFVELETLSMCMERVEGRSLQQLLPTLGVEEREAHLAEVGRVIARLHDAGVIHGDLRSSHFIIRDKDKALVLTSFLQSKNTLIAEDRARDLHLLETSLSEEHSDLPGLFDKVMESYKRRSRVWSSTFNRMADVRQRASKRAKLEPAVE